MNWLQPTDALANQKSFDSDPSKSEKGSVLPFSTQRRMRLWVLTMVVGGGLILVICMRFLTGGPQAALASTEDSQAISQYLNPFTNAASSSTNDPLAILARFDSKPVRIPLDSLRSNPFVLPGSFVSGPSSLPLAAADQARTSRGEEMKLRIAAMRVAMVLQGRHSVAMIDDISLPINREVELDTRMHLMLTDITASTITVRAIDPTIQVSVDVVLDRP